MVTGLISLLSASLGSFVGAQVAADSNVRMQVDQFTTGIALVAAGQGIMLSTAYVGPFLKEHALRLIPLVNPSVRRRIMLFRHAAKLLSPAADRFAGFLKEHLAADQEPG